VNLIVAITIIVFVFLQPVRRSLNSLLIARGLRALGYLCPD
jgi:hypothetical protein